MPGAVENRECLKQENLTGKYNVSGLVQECER